MHPTPSTSTSPESFRQPYSPALTDGPSPAKRRKTATPGTSSSSSIRGSSVFWHTFPDSQLDTERRASSVRLLNTWSALQEKYDRPLHKDDIVDLRSGALLKDRGVLSSDSRTWDIGCFADVDDAVDQEGPDIPVVDENDEMGAWESETELYAQLTPVRVPPVRELDPLDAQDLQDFLAAENARKVAQGIDDGDVDDGVDQTVSPSMQRSSPDIQLQRSYSTESVIDVEAGSVLVISSSESDDELCGYDDAAGEGGLLWQIDENMDPFEPVIMTPGRGRRRFVQQSPPQCQTPTQLQTPPLSHSLSVSVTSPTSSSFAITSKKSLSTSSRSNGRPPRLFDSYAPSLPKASTRTKSDVSRPLSIVPDEDNPGTVLRREMPSKRRPEVVLLRGREKVTNPQKTQSRMTVPFDSVDESGSLSAHSQEHIRQRSRSRPRNTEGSSINNSFKFKAFGKRKQFPAEKITSRDSSQSPPQADCLGSDGSSSEHAIEISNNEQQNSCKPNKFRQQGTRSPSHNGFFSSDGSPQYPRPSQPPVDDMQLNLRTYIAQIGLSLLGMASTPNGWQYPPLPRQENVIPATPYGSTSPWSFSSPLISPRTSVGAQPCPTSPSTVSASGVNFSSQNSPLSYKRRRSRRVSFPQSVDGSEDYGDRDDIYYTSTKKRGLRKGFSSGDDAEAHSLRVLNNISGSGAKMDKGKGKRRC